MSKISVRILAYLDVAAQSVVKLRSITLILIYIHPALQAKDARLQLLRYIHRPTAKIWYLITERHELKHKQASSRKKRFLWNQCRQNLSLESPLKKRILKY